MKLEYKITNLTKYNSIKAILKEEFLMSDRLIAKLKNTSQIYINSKPVYINHIFSIGDILSVNLDFNEDSANIVPTKMELDILYEDENMLILNKPAGIPVHPSMEHYNDSLSNGVKYYFNQISLKRKIRPVNRLDRNTSGIVIFAKNQYVQECLIKQMKTDDLKKEYLALVNGNLFKKEQIISAPISRKENSIIERCVNTNGNEAITIVELLKNFDNYSLIKCILKTGRTHQIRVHMQFIKHSILGDTLYGVSSNLINRQALHAYKVSFTHPITKENITIIAELPEDMKRLINN